MIKFSENKKSLESQQKIYKGLRQILLRKSLCDITIADIKEECGISRSTFYRNFSNIVEVLEVTFNYFYARYLDNRVDKENQLLYFYQYWYKHRDLITIIAKENESIIKNCIKYHEHKEHINNYEFDIKVSMMTSLLSSWSKSKKETPEEMERITKKMLNQKCIDVLLN